MKNLDFIETQIGVAPEYAVIWLHGLGADGHDFVPIIPELGLPNKPGIRFIFPHAPMRPITLNGGMVMRGWYDIVSLNFENRADAHGVRESAQQIAALIEREQNRGIRSERIFLAGFSQGGAIALFTALRYSQTLAGIIVLSTYLPLATELENERNAANKNIPIFYAHGSYDNVIALRHAHASVAYLRALGYQPEWHEYPMMHSVCQEEIQALSIWLQKNCK